MGDDRVSELLSILSVEKRLLEVFKSKPQSGFGRVLDFFIEDHYVDRSLQNHKKFVRDCSLLEDQLLVFEGLQEHVLDDLEDLLLIVLSEYLLEELDFLQRLVLNH